jgi:hypothetical protein
MPDDLPMNSADSSAPQPAKRRPNAALWLGFLITMFAFLSYIPIFAKYPITRDVPWANYLIFALGLPLLFAGVLRAFRQPAAYRGKIAGPILGTLGVLSLGFFCLTIFSLGKHLPPSAQAPKVGQKAPEFTLNDANGATVSLASLLATPGAAHPPKGVLVIFYRGYW